MDHVKNLRKNKFNAIAFLISICLLIVFFCHHIGYTTYFNLGELYKLKIMTIFANFAVGGFLFLSAYKLTKSKKSLLFVDFWKNRFIRIYPFYFFALIIFTIFINTDKTLLNFFINALFLKSLFPRFGGEEYLTLWFVGLLFLYYFYFSIINKLIKRKLIFIFLTIGVFMALFIIKELIRKQIVIFTFAFFIYYFIFISGMLFADYEKHIRFSFLSRVFLLLISAISIFFLFLYLNNLLTIKHYLLQVFLTSFSFVPIYILIISIDSNFILLNKFLTNLSYASFGMFLFHRPIWQIMNNFWNQQNLFQWFYIVLLGPIIIFGVSYGIQYVYDKAIHLLKKK